MSIGMIKTATEMTEKTEIMIGMTEMSQMMAEKTKD